MKPAVNSNLSIGDELLTISHSRFNSAITKLQELGELQFYKKSQVLFNPGSIARGIYLIDSGKIKVSKFGIDGKEQILKILTRGDVVGHEALLYENRFNEYAEVVEDASIYYVTRDDFNMVCHKDDKILIYFTKLLCKELNDVEERLVSAAYEPVRGRVAHLLIELSEIYGGDNGHVATITLSRGDLARIAGTAKETTIRLLSEFKREGLITMNGSAIKVSDINGLKRIIALYR